MKKPILFVGSSSEAAGLIRGLELNLADEDVEVRSWRTDPWRLSGSTLSEIEKKLGEAHFAAFILADDDIAVIRGQEIKVARDNVVFELGMSFGRIERERTFIVLPKTAEHLASDLSGLVVVPYDPDPDEQKAMKVPASRLWSTIKRYGLRDGTGIDGTARRGATGSIAVVADAALEVFASRDAYFDALHKAVVDGEKVPAKFQFAAADGGRHWLKLCKSPTYHYFHRAKAHLDDNVARLVDGIRGAAGSAAVDLVSLGSGDGAKDGVILRALASDLPDEQHLYYYPIDISDILLTEAVRHVSRNGPNTARYRCKALLGDFTNPSSLRQIIDYRANTKLFCALGNVIGSFDELEIFDGIRDVMGPGDLVLIEANIGEPQNSEAMLEDDAANQWDLSTLAALDIPTETCKLKLDEELNQSIVDKTRTLVSYAVPNSSHGKYILSGLHHYDFEALKRHVEKALHVTLLDDLADGGVCLLLGQRTG